MCGLWWTPSQFAVCADCPWGRGMGPCFHFSCGGDCGQETAGLSHGPLMDITRPKSSPLWPPNPRPLHAYQCVAEKTYQNVCNLLFISSRDSFSKLKVSVKQFRRLVIKWALWCSVACRTFLHYMDVHYMLKRMCVCGDGVLMVLTVQLE